MDKMPVIEEAPSRPAPSGVSLAGIPLQDDPQNSDRLLKYPK